ncbi:unnamed protein product [marine sediment metagenome]|uniref:Uncharacterized protein n=1 Tax=marine sediment metagenome TaxID=412755 RepID=X0TD47_9ZZZZ
MPHFHLVKTDDILNGPVDYSTPVGDARVFKCSVSAKDHIERRFPVARKIYACPWKNKLLYSKFCIHTGESPEYVNYTRNKNGIWYAEAVSF